MTTNQLLIESADGQPLLLYRIRGGNVEVWVPDDPRSHSSEESSWKPLSVRELGAHLSSNPALALWLHAHARRHANDFDDPGEGPEAA